MLTHHGASVRRAALLAAITVVVAVTGCGAEGKSANPLEWKTEPDVIVPPKLRGDRILRGDVTNGSLDRVVVEAKDIRLVDADGRQVGGTATFLSGYAHSIFPPTNQPSPYPESERQRLGKVARIEPGQSAPLTVSWHEPKGPRTPVRIDYGNGTLSIPR
jgi:hypothetical protein